MLLSRLVNYEDGMRIAQCNTRQMNFYVLTFFSRNERQEARGFAVSLGIGKEFSSPCTNDE